MISGCNVVVSVCFDAFDCVVMVKLLVFDYHSEDLLIDRHFLTPRKEPSHSLLFDLLEPRMVSDLLNCVPLLRIRV